MYDKKEVPMMMRGAGRVDSRELEGILSNSESLVAVRYIAARSVKAVIIELWATPDRTRKRAVTINYCRAAIT
jgi:hypothetical protein